MNATRHAITVHVNGAARTTDVEARTSLADLLRHELRLTGTHVACEQGVCGSCTVLLDGVPVRSCLMFAVQSDGRTVETVESLSGGESTADALDRFQRAMSDCHGLQCGFCTPGILMSVTAARREGLGVDETTHDVLGGHVCRCTGYQGIRDAIRTTWDADARDADGPAAGPAADTAARDGGRA
ncbi:(2Fe-2S)-binding protein [Yinghuangia aomiensis]|uniref:(2Fe-2S)-binding protein n=1 Tax=Yinghuangia aomiensis TaxID=676205 RepID=A0ABP9I459_9ACTN